MSDEAPSNVPSREFTVDDSDAGLRLDVLLAREMPEFSRVHLRRVITAGEVTVDGKRAKPAYRLNAGQIVHAAVPDIPREGPQPENIPLEILFEDDWLVAINKPAGMVVHPAKGHWQGTLTAALAFHFQQLSGIGGPTRPGIVHRLDRETSGVIVVAKTDAAHLHLAKQFEERTTRKEYFAITAGAPNRDRDIIRQPIGVHPYQREKMAIRAGHATSRDAETFYEVVQRHGPFATVRVTPKTGRTHQIRVHLAHIGCPILCDRLYSGRSRLNVGDLDRQAANGEELLLQRAALHARKLEVLHPNSNQPITFETDPPEDIERTLAAIMKYC